MERKIEDLTGKNIIVYDLEIKKPIEECSKGWSGYDEMGISVGCAFDYREMRYRVFLDDNMQELVDRLNEPDTLIVAFNHIPFDNKLLRENNFNLKPDNELKNYDMLQKSRLGANVNQFVKGFKLDHHLKCLGLPMKIADGKMAPLWYKEGKIGKCIDYCLGDVTVEKGLFEYIWINGELKTLGHPEPYKIDLKEIEDCININNNTQNQTTI